MKTKVHLLPALAMDDPANLVVPAQSAVHLVPRAILAEQVGVRVPLDANAGHILGETADCNLVALTGVHLSLSSDAVGPPPLQFYFGENRSASVTATETLAEGAFGFANVPQGPVAIDATIPSLGRKLAHVEIFVDKDTISTFQLGPSYLAP